jgi:outer membrane protein W
MWLVFALFACGTARAQDHGDVGIAMAYPAAIGVIWHASPAVAVRPDFTFSTSHSEGSSVETDSWSIGAGVSALFYVGSSDRVRPYVSPRVSYTRGSSEANAGTFESSNRGWGFSGSFGAEYTPASKFGVFGEVGVGFTRSTAESNVSFGGTENETKSRGAGMRAGVGVIFYF